MVSTSYFMLPRLLARCESWYVGCERVKAWEHPLSGPRLGTSRWEGRLRASHCHPPGLQTRSPTLADRSQLFDTECADYPAIPLDHRSLLFQLLVFPPS